MQVVIKQGTKVPREGKWRSYHQEGVPFEMPDTAYYRRRLADGSLLPSTPATPAAAPAQAEVPPPKEGPAPRARK